MPNALVAAAARGLPAAAFNRRRMLLGLAAASSAAAVPVASAARARAEDPELIQLGDKSAALGQAYQAAVAEREAIVAAWAPEWPPVPDEIKVGLYGVQGEIAYGLGGEMPSPIKQYHLPEHFKLRAAAIREPHRYRKGTSPATIAKGAALQEEAAAQADAVALISERYCAERRRIREVSGIIPANAKANEAREALIRHVASIMERQPLTMAGAVIQAEALEVLSAVPPLRRYVRFLTSMEELPAWGEQLAATILRLARSAS